MKPEILKECAEQIFAAGLGRVPNATVARSLIEYVQSVAKFNAGADLVGAKTEKSLAEIVLADALVAARHPELLHAPLYEIGAGGAALAIVLAVLIDSLTVELIEPRHKRAAFLRLAGGALKLSARVNVQQGTLGVDRVPPGVAGTSMARAVWAPNEWLAIAEQLTRPDGTILVTTTPVHLEAAPINPPKSLRELAREEYELPFSRARRVQIWYGR